MAGIGAVGFAAVVLSVNAFLGSTPAMDATGAQVLEHLDEHRAAFLWSTAAAALTGPLLLVFVAGFYGCLRRVVPAGDVVLARMGALGALLILPTFCAVVVPRIVLLGGGLDAQQAGLVWRLESAAFLLNGVPLCVAVFGLGLAAARNGLVPGWFRFVALVVPPIGIIGPFFAVAGLEGNDVVMLPGLAVFVSWMLFLLMAGVRQLRAAD
jgi:hypothetical protein